MSRRRTPVPPTRDHSRSRASGRKGLIAMTENKKQSAKRRTVLDDRFHRTYHAFSCERPPRASGRAARRLPTFDDHGICSRRDAVQTTDGVGASAPGQRTAARRLHAELGDGSPLLPFSLRHLREDGKAPAKEQQGHQREQPVGRIGQPHKQNAAPEHKPHPKPAAYPQHGKKDRERSDVRRLDYASQPMFETGVWQHVTRSEYASRIKRYAAVRLSLEARVSQCVEIPDCCLRAPNVPS